MQGVVTGAANIYLKRGITNVLAKHPEIKIVSDQSANYDPAKARAIMETVLQQNPDLCGAVGVWDSADVGIGAAVQAAGKTGQVFVVTSGGGNKSRLRQHREGPAVDGRQLQFAVAGQHRRPADRRALADRRTRPASAKCSISDR